MCINEKYSDWAQRKTNSEIITGIDRLLKQHTESQIAHQLNGHGWRSSTGCQFNLRMVIQLRRAYKLKNRQQRLREQDWLTVPSQPRTTFTSTPAFKRWTAEV